MTELNKFEWCEGCGKGLVCAKMCGADFWRYTKDHMKEFTQNIKPIG